MTRKELVHKLAEHLETAPVYLGAPSFAYQVGDYTVDRHSNISDKEGQEVELDELLNGEGEPGLETVREQEKITAAELTAEIGAASLTKTKIETETINLEIGWPLEEHQGKSLRNLIHIIYSKQPLIKKALDLETDLISQEVIDALDQEAMETLDDFQKVIEDTGCPGIDFDFEKEITIFKLGQNGDDPDKIKAATQLLTLINKNALELKRKAPAKVRPTDNEKYTFRTWLVRLGMIGDEYKTARNVLLKNLSGNSAFRTQAKEEI